MCTSAARWYLVQVAQLYLFLPDFLPDWGKTPFLALHVACVHLGQRKVEWALSASMQHAVSLLALQQLSVGWHDDTVARRPWGCFWVRRPLLRCHAVLGAACCIGRVKQCLPQAFMATYCSHSYCSHLMPPTCCVTVMIGDHDAFVNCSDWVPKTHVLLKRS